MLINHQDKTRYSWFHYNVYFEYKNLFQCHCYIRERFEHNVKFRFASTGFGLYKKYQVNAENCTQLYQVT